MAGNVPYRLTYVIGELGKGGAEYQLYELLRGLDRRQFAPSVIALAAGGYWAGPMRALDIPVHEIPASGSADLGRLRRLRAQLRALAPHVLHTVLWSGNSYGRLAAIGLGIPVVLTAERNVIARPSWQVMIERMLDPLTDRYLVNCQAIADGLVQREGLAGEKMVVIHNGIDLTRLAPFTVDRRPARTALGFDPARRLVAQVGRLAPQKDYPTFLRAAAMIASQHADVDFLIVGEGGLRDALEAQVRELGLADRVRFLGLRHDVPALLGAVDVLALTSLYEGLPNVVIEAMSAGAVAVATDVGGCRDLVLPDRTGILVAPQDAAGVAGAIGRLLRDQDSMVRTATAARHHIETEFAMATMVQRTSAVYLDRLRAAGIAPATVAAA